MRRSQDQLIEVEKQDVYDRILELDLRKMEKRHERHIWHIKSMWGGVSGLLIAIYLTVTAQYFNGNALFVGNNNYLMIAGILLLSIAFCYGLMWVGVIREYQKFERIINNKIQYYQRTLQRQ